MDDGIGDTFVSDELKQFLYARIDCEDWIENAINPWHGLLASINGQVNTNV